MDECRGDDTGKQGGGGDRWWGVTGRNMAINLLARPDRGQLLTAADDIGAIAARRLREHCKKTNKQTASRSDSESWAHLHARTQREREREREREKERKHLRARL